MPVKLQSLGLAIQFLTRIPVPSQGKPTNKQFGSSILWFPVVGVLIGCIGLALAHIFHDTDTPVRAALLLTAWVLITGGLHLDGLADCTDAWVGGQANRERSIAIMKDPHAGPAAVVILVLVMLLKYSAILTLLEKNSYTELLLAPAVGRTAILALMLNTPYVSQGGLATKFLEHFPKRRALCVVTAVAVVLLIALDLTTLLGSILALFALRAMMVKRLGGATGDTYGASVEILETIIVLLPALR